MFKAKNDQCSLQKFVFEKFNSRKSPSYKVRPLPLKLNAIQLVLRRNIVLTISNNCCKYMEFCFKCGEKHQFLNV